MFCVVTGVLYYKEVTVNYKSEVENNNTNIIDSKSEIYEIPVESINGITKEDAEKLCYLYMGEKDEKTGFTYSFGVSGAVKKDNKQFYVVRASWLVNNSHLSYIGDFFVSSDGKEIYDGLAQQGEYKIIKLVWSK